ncbi:MAG: hypothetical protein LBH44_14440 [Treponema sp.]|jgi:hypothetical protein|nr:hypothetical protein [Treponema sp.]
MKKFIFIMVAVTFAFLAGCASEGGSMALGGEPQEKKPWRLSREEGGLAARNNQVTLRKQKDGNYLYIYFPVVGAEFESIQIDFTIDKPLEVVWQCVYQVGAVLGSTEVIGVMDKGPIITPVDFAGFDKAWYGNGPVVKPKVNGLCLKVTDPDGGSVFTLTDVSFIGLQEPVDEEE